jgi:hypothetical protein
MVPHVLTVVIGIGGLVISALANLALSCTRHTAHRWRLLTASSSVTVVNDDDLAVDLDLDDSSGEHRGVIIIADHDGDDDDVV